MRINSSEVGAVVPFFPQILVIPVPWILLHGNVQNFTWNILTLKDDININFASLACEGDTVVTIFSDFF